MVQHFAIMVAILAFRPTTPSRILQPSFQRQCFHFLFRGGGGGGAETTDLAASRSFPRQLHGRYQVSVSSIQGMRRYMEDEFSAQDDFVGVFDGHGGNAISQYLRLNLYGNLLHESAKTEDAITALRKSLSRLDDQVCRIKHWSFQGSTVAAVWFVTPQRMVIAGVGDSRAILASSQHDEVHQLTRDHRPDCPDEIQRIHNVGGRVELVMGYPRVNGNLALSRAIGDRSERPAISGEPDMTAYDIDEETDEFIVVGTDGLFDVMVRAISDLKLLSEV